MRVQSEFPEGKCFWGVFYVRAGRAVNTWDAWWRPLAWSRRPSPDGQFPVLTVTSWRDQIFTEGSWGRRTLKTSNHRCPSTASFPVSHACHRLDLECRWAEEDRSVGALELQELSPRPAGWHAGKEEHFCSQALDTCLRDQANRQKSKDLVEFTKKQRFLTFLLKVLLVQHLPNKNPNQWHWINSH